MPRWLFHYIVKLSLASMFMIFVRSFFTITPLHLSRFSVLNNYSNNHG